MSVRLRLGWRREVVLLLPIATLILVLLSTFTLFAFRSGIELLVESRRQEAAALAERLASTLAEEPPPSSLLLRQLAPGARSVALLDSQGNPVLAYGLAEEIDLLAPLEGRRLERAAGFGPDPSLPRAVAGYARFASGGRDYLLRVELDADRLAREARSVRILTWVVLPINVALAALLLLFLRHVLSPFDALMKQVRQIEPEGRGDDDISILVDTVKRALSTLAAAPEPAADAEVQALQRMLGPSLQSGVMLLDRRGRVLSLNPAGVELLGGPAASAAPDPQAELSRHPAFAAAVAEAVRSPSGVRRREVEIESADSRRTFGLTVHPLLRDDGTVRGYLALFVDLTESRRRAEEERLATSLDQLGAITAGVAHEMRNGLATLKGYLGLIERRPDEESIADYLSEMRRESDHLQRVLEDFLSFARPETTRLSEIDLLRVIRRAAADPALEGKEVEISSAEAVDSRIKGDSQLLERAVRNLLHNALEADRQSGVTSAIEVTLRERGGEIEVWIDDHGPGVPPGLEERLFQPFVTTRGGGVGMGLALAHRIVSLHGGRLRLESREPGGARAVITLPRLAGRPPGTIG